MGDLYLNNDDLIVFSKDDAILHGCNTKGVMGVGAAELIKKTYDVSMFSRYVLDCNDDFFKPGGIMVFEQPQLPILYNLGIQPKPGKFASLDFVKSSLDLAVQDMESKNLKSASITPLGSFNGGLELDTVLNVIQGTALNSSIDFTVYLRRQERRDGELIRTIPLNPYL